MSPSSVMNWRCVALVMLYMSAIAVLFPGGGNASYRPPTKRTQYVQPQDNRDLNSMSPRRFAYKQPKLYLPANNRIVSHDSTSKYPRYTSAMTIIRETPPIKIRRVLTEVDGVLKYKRVKGKKHHRKSKKHRSGRRHGRKRFRQPTPSRNAYNPTWPSSTKRRKNDLNFPRSRTKTSGRKPTYSTYSRHSIEPTVVRVPNPSLNTNRYTTGHGLKTTDSYRTPKHEVDPTLSHISPPVGFRIVKLPTAITRSSANPGRKNFTSPPPKIAATPRSSPSATSVLRIQTTSMAEAQRLVSTLNGGFKVSFSRPTARQIAQNKPTTKSPSFVPSLQSRSTVQTDAGKKRFAGTAQRVVRRKMVKWWEGDHVCTKVTPGLYGLSNAILRRIKKKEKCEEEGDEYICVETYGFGKRAPTKTTTQKCCNGFHVSLERASCVSVPTSQRRGVNRSGTSVVERGAFSLRSAPDFELLTIFMPSDDVVLSQFMLNNETNPDNNVEQFLESHVIPKHKLYSEEIRNNERFVAISGNLVRVNFFDTDLDDVMTVNCHEVTQRDVDLDNTIVHYIDDVISMVSQSVYDYVIARPEQFSTLINVLTSSGLLEKLRLESGNFTLFAPTNEAFDAANLNIDSGICVRTLAENLISETVMCTVAAKDYVQAVKTIGNETITIDSRSGHAIVNGTNVIINDVMTTNGVVQVLDRVIKPEKIMTILDVLMHEKNISHIVEMFQAAGTKGALSTGNNFTLIVPTNKAFKRVPKREMMRLVSNVDELRNLLMYHIVPDVLTTGDLRSRTRLTTMNPPKNIVVSRYTRKIRVLHNGKKKYMRRNAVALQCARMLGQPRLKPCNGAIFIVDRVLRPPEGSILSTLMYSKKSNFSILLSAISNARISRVLDGVTDSTFFAPSNAAFARFPAHVTKRILGNTPLLIRVIKFHLVKGYYCSNQLMQKATRHRSLLGANLISCPKKRRLYLGRKRNRLRAKVVESDIQATNGIIHAIDNLLLPKKFNLRLRH